MKGNLERVSKLAWNLRKPVVTVKLLVNALASYLTDSEMSHLAAQIKGPSYFLSRKLDGMRHCDVRGYISLGAPGRALECLTIPHMYLDVEVHEL